MLKTKRGGRNAIEFESAIGCTAEAALGCTIRHFNDYRHCFDLLNRRVRSE
jgi:hypothetical protein